MRWILITGVAGMIGSHLLDSLLIKGYNIIGIDNLSFGSISNIKHNLSNSNFKFLQLDICKLTDLKKIEDFNIDAIIHLAAHKKIHENQNPIPIFFTNGNGTQNILELAREKKARVIFASSSDVYGMSDKLPLKEEYASLIGRSSIKRWAYAVSKLYGEQLVFSYSYQYKIPIIILRYFGGFSERASKNWSGGQIPVFINSILHNKKIFIHGDGSQTRSMAYVDDLVAGTILALESSNAFGEIFNIGNDEEISVLETAKLIHTICHTENYLRLKLVPFAQIGGDYSEIMRRVPDLTKANSILNYQPKIKFYDGLKLTIDYLKMEK